MVKFTMLLAGMCLSFSLAFSQGRTSLAGQVTDEHNKPLPGATVILHPSDRGTLTDSLGRYAFNGLEEGWYQIDIAYLGYSPLSDTLRLVTNRSYNARLRTATLTLQEVVVTDHYENRRRKEEPLNLEIVGEEYLRQNLGGSLMQSLDRLPGVSSMDIGSGQSKPVIRGLGFNRVVVVENGIKHEAQQWGSDHGLEIDQYAIDRIEVIKGPASLMYGSDAIGGIIDVKNRKIPADRLISGTIDLTGKTNNDLVGTSVSLSGRKKWLFAEFRATLLSYGDYKVPVDSVDIYSYRAALYKNHLRNTAGNEQNVHADIGILLPKLRSTLHVSSVNAKSGFFANAHGLEPRKVDTLLHDHSSRDINYPYQEVNHLKIINNSQYILGRVKLESDLGFQRNFRQEWSQYVSHGYMPALFPDTLSFHPDLERQFDKYVWSGSLKLTYDRNNRAQYTFGLNSDFQDNRIEGRSFIIPAFRHRNIGGFAFARYSLSAKSLLKFGIRYDRGSIAIQKYLDWFPSPVIDSGDTTLRFLERAAEVNRSFSSITWSAGYTFNTDFWSVKANIGKSFRMPIAKELAANGVNYHHFSYEVGNSDLSPEVSYQLDAGIEHNSEKLAIGATPFLNYFPNYIYLNPGSEHDRLYGNGNQVFNYTQSKVFRYGAEMHMHYQPWKFLQLGLIAEYIYSEQISGEKQGFTLPFSPPATAILNMKYRKQKIAFFNNIYISIDYELTAAQTNIVPPEEVTDGYQVIHIGFGGEVKLKDQSVHLAFQVQNLLNRQYYNHTSYYRLIHVPEPGRSLVMNLSIPFSGTMDRKK